MARSGAIRTRSGSGYKPSALRGYEQALRLRVLPDLGGARLSAITRSDLQRLVGRMQERKLSASTIRNTFLPLRADLPRRRPAHRRWRADKPDRRPAASGGAGQTRPDRNARGGGGTDRGFAEG